MLSGADPQNLDADLHREVVQLVRRAAERALDEDSPLFMLRQIEKLATEGTVAADAQSLLGSADTGDGSAQ